MAQGSRAIRLGTIFVSAVLCLALTASEAPAFSDFKLNRIREVYPGSTSGADSEYVELQAYGSGQNAVGGHSITVYGPTGTLTGTDTFAGDLPNGSNQATLLLATTQAESEFGGLTADATISPAGQLNPAGGAVCWETFDCVSWGNFTGTLPSAAGSPVDPTGITDGQAIRRTIAPHCSTLLELGDDSNDSAIDLFEVFPAPRPNSVTPTEHSCLPPPPPVTPQTIITSGPKGKTYNRTPAFRFDADYNGVTFSCRLDAKPFAPCTSPRRFARLAIGAHTFEVAATLDGRTDATPAKRSFRVLRKHRHRH